MLGSQEVKSQTEYVVVVVEKLPKHMEIDILIGVMCQTEQAYRQGYRDNPFVLPKRVSTNMLHKGYFVGVHIFLNIKESVNIFLNIKGFVYISLDVKELIALLLISPLTLWNTR